MIHWKTETIKQTLSAVPGITFAEIGEQGSERTTELLAYNVAGATDRLYVRGFVTDKQLNQSDDVDVEMIEVFTEYSDGGDSQEPENVAARGLMMAALLKAGYKPVVRSLEPYF